ncbi:MAG: AraC-like DNA-binding protein [Arcticibacterium sp.]|jgi:AraC-like DNA-binding protein
MYPVFSEPLFKWGGVIVATLFMFLSLFILSHSNKGGVIKKYLFALTLATGAETFYLVFHSYLPSIVEDMLIGIPTLLGPLVFFYIQSKVTRNKKAQVSDFLSFVPFFTILALPFVPDFYYRDFKFLAIIIVIFHWGSFLLFCGVWMSSNLDKLNKMKIYETNWVLTFFALNVVMWVGHTLLYYIGEPLQLFYIATVFVITVSLVLYYFKFRAYESASTSKKNKAKSSLSKPPPFENSQFIVNKIIKLTKLMNVDKVYFDPNLTIPKMADKVQIQPYLLSQIINTHFGQSYPDYVNTYRIKEAKSLLTDNSLKISSVAMDSGFNTLSSFNVAFKKATGKTPSNYREHAMNE